MATKSSTADPKAKRPRLKKVSSRKPAPQSAPETNWQIALRAADAKQAKEICALDLRDMTSFTDTLIVCGGTSTRQNQTISNEIEDQLKKAGEYAMSVEGYSNGEWILMDYGDFVVNIFTEKARAYYDLERMWRDAKKIEWVAAAS